MRLLTCSILLVLLGCATQPEPRPARSSYPGRCMLIGIEQRELPSDQRSDQVELVARYRFGAPSEPRQEPVTFAFQVTRARADDLRSHLAANADVLCRPYEEDRSIDLPPSEQIGSLEPVPERWRLNYRGTCAGSPPAGQSPSGPTPLRGSLPSHPSRTMIGLLRSLY